MSNFMFDELTVAKSEFVKLYLLIFFNLKSDFTEFGYFFNTCKHIFGVCGYGHVPGMEIGIHLLAGLAPSSHTAGSLLRTP